jgi:Co/Zn/Cd efflux system component
MNETTFKIPKMDCPSEERLIRMALPAEGIHSIEFDIPNRKLVIQHLGESNLILEKLVPLGFGAVIEETKLIDDLAISNRNEDQAGRDGERKVLIWLLALNGLMFVVEIIAGWLAQSAGLLADGLDMFADAAVYAMALYAVGKAAENKLNAARFVGMIELVLAAGAIGRVIYQIYSGAEPEAHTMIWISILALAVNVTCVYLISGRKNDGVHMKASYIFSANDVIANLAVIIAGFFVAWFNSPIPDWVAGIGIGFLVLSGAIRILRLK